MQNRESSGLWMIKLIVFFILVIIALFGYVLSKEIRKKNQVKNEIDSLRREAENIKKENMAMEERISYLNSQDYQEREARERLSLQSPDEKVVIFSPGPEKKEIISNEIISIPNAKSNPLPNYQKWWNYFFNK